LRLKKKVFPARRLTVVEFFCILDRSSYEKRDEEKAMNQLSKVVCTAAACLVAAVTVNRAENSQRSARDFAWVQERAQKLEPTAKERSLDEIGWAGNIREAERLAKQNNRPVFLFTHDGRINTGRC